ncbi:MAG: serine hydrolase [Lewinellaceae bacterium]|nr:serine hydrolase [Lewinellaceae bacterium]
MKCSVLYKGIIAFLFTLLVTGVSAQVWENRTIDSLFANWNNAHSPGCALGIMKDGQLIYSRGYGMANLEYSIPNTDTTVFRIGSTSKQFTAACIIRLVEQGRLTLDKTLQEIFPDFPDYAKKITIRHLLNHTSGIRDYLQLSFLKGLGDDDFYTDDDVMAWLVNQRDLNFEPGAEFLYSNSGYWLLGQIVLEVAGMNLAEFAARELFQPLGMEHTHFHNDHTRIVKYRASGYVPDPRDGYRISMTTLDMIGDGGIFTTIKDLKIWDDAFYNSTVLSKSFWEMMTRQGILNNGEQIDYASGLFIGNYKGLKMIRHGGAFVGFRAEMLRFPEQHVTIAILANRSDARPSSLANKVADIVLKDVIPAQEKIQTDDGVVPARQPEKLNLEQLAGNYELQAGMVLKVTIENDTLVVEQSWDKVDYHIVRTDGNTFVIPHNDGILFTFSKVEDGFSQQLEVLQSGNKMHLYRKPTMDPSQVNLADYAGDYYSQELDVTYHFRLEDDILVVQIDKKATAACSISGPDAISMYLGLARFLRSGGKITGFELDSGRVKNLKFEKLN